jgi:hypothetical protein
LHRIIEVEGAGRGTVVVPQHAGNHGVDGERIAAVTVMVRLRVEGSGCVMQV